MNEETLKQNRLPGLNGLRAIAASFVLFGHVFQITAIYGDQQAKSLYNAHKIMGLNMVNLFFVISGFIITHILIKEKIETGQISLTNFYLKRSLRIWPLYFGLLLIVTILLQFTNLYSDFAPLNFTGYILIIFFLVPFGSFFSRPGFSVLPHYWSLSVEEQFYLGWPVIFRKLTIRGAIFFSISVIIGMIVLRNGFIILNSYSPLLFYYKVIRVLNFSMFGSIAIGILGACLAAGKYRILNFIFKPVIQLSCWLVFISSVLLPYKIPYIHFELMGIVDLVLVLNVAYNHRAIISLRNKLFDTTGKISYGIYMYHWPLIPLLIIGSKKIGLWNFFIKTYQLPFLILSYLVTYLIAWLSYKYVESYFLKLRPESWKKYHYSTNFQKA